MASVTVSRGSRSSGKSSSGSKVTVSGNTKNIGSSTLAKANGGSTKKTSSGSSQKSSGQRSSGSIPQNNRTVAYDKNVDYAAELDKAVKAGASQTTIDRLNAQRNAKIAGEKSGYTQFTDNDIANYKSTAASNAAKNKAGGTVGAGSSYTPKSGGLNGGTGGVAYNKNTDYASELEKAIKRGASQSEIDMLNAQRNAKIKGEGLSNSGLTNSDFENYRNTGSWGNAGGSPQNTQGGGVYGQNSTSATRNPTDEDISGLAQSTPYDPNNLRGYADPEGSYNTRQTAFTVENPDGTISTFFSNATRFDTAIRDAIAAGLAQPGAKLKYSSTYGTGSLSGDGFNYGVTAANNGMSGFANGNEGKRYVSDKQYGTMYDQNNMQLAFLSGRDGLDYTNPYADLNYNGNGLNNAFNHGLDFAGQGNIMGGYNANFKLPDGTQLNDYAREQETLRDLLNGGLINETIYGGDANYSGTAPGYVGLTAEDIQNQMNDIYASYGDAMNQVNSALKNSYDYQRQQLEADNEERQRANYINYRLAGLNMPAQMQALGLNGGAAESTLSGLESDYMKNYNDAANSLTDAVTQLKIAEENALANGNMEAAKTYSSLMQSSLQLQMQAAAAENSYNQWAQEMAFAKTQWEAEQARYQMELALQQRQAAQAAEQDQKNRLIQYAMQIGDYDSVQRFTGLDTSYAQQQREEDRYYDQLDRLAGYYATGDDWAGYGNLTGVDTSYKQKQQQATLSKLLNTGRSGGGSGRSSSKGKAVTASQYDDLYEAYNSGNYSAYEKELNKLKTLGYTKNLDDITNSIMDSSNIWYRANRSGGRSAVEKDKYVM